MSSAVTSAGAGAYMAAKYSQLAGALLGNKSIWHPTGNQALTPAYIDDTVSIPQSNGVQTPLFGSKLQFNLPKTAGLVGKAFIEITLTAGRDNSLQNPAVTDGFANSFDPNLAYNSAGAFPAGTNMPLCEYVKNVGDLIVDQHQLVYGNANLQQFPGLFHYLFRRICQHDVNIEATNAQVLGALPPGKFFVFYLNMHFGCKPQSHLVRCNSIISGKSNPLFIFLGGNVNSGSERVLVDAFYRGVTLLVPLEEYFWVSRKSEHWMPESLALEGQLTMTLVPVGQIINTSSRSLAVVGTLPTISNVVLRYQEITLSAAEKENRLKLYKSPQGLVTHFLDLEQQLTFQQAGIAPRTVWGANPAAPQVGPPAYVPLSQRPNMTMAVPLNNLRMDMVELIFCVHRVGYNASHVSASGLPDFPGENGILSTVGGGSYAEANNLVGSILFPTSPAPAGWTFGVNSANNNSANQTFATQIQVSNFSITAAGKNLLSFQTDLLNKTHVRKYYHPGSQTDGHIYVIPFSPYPEDRFNATGHMSASVLGSMQLLINLPDPGPSITYQVDVYCHSANLMQSRAGGIVKALY